MIKLSNNHPFQFMTASGALAFDGRGWPWEWPLRWTGFLDPTLFTIVTKTLTRHPRKGNLRWSRPWDVVRKVEKKLGMTVTHPGVVNAIGLTNKGIDWWLQEVAPKIPKNYKIVVSIEADDETETVEMVKMLQECDILGIELNLSCPNSEAAGQRTTDKIIEICQAASKNSSFPLIAKLSYTHDYLNIVKALDSTDAKMIEAISINSIPWQVVFPNQESPLAKFGGGGVSGRIVQPYTWKMAEEMAKASKIPVIGSSVWDYEDIDKVLDKGAQAVSFGSIFVRHPWRPTAFIRRWLREHKEFS